MIMLLDAVRCGGRKQKGRIAEDLITLRIRFWAYSE